MSTTSSPALKGGFGVGIPLGVPAFLLAILAMLIVPLPAFALDISFTFNIALSLVIIMACVYTQKPLDFATFPTVILLVTLLRLALNIASTRVVLLEGHTGPDAAGHVIQAFGEFVIGGNFAVGMVVFSILVIINFVVVTKGAGRISEVSARFTLDAMPGKQMAIDADLSAGIIDHEESRRRREEVVSEADFYGSMDGASKFVKGDAIAGILILFINIIGGLLIGVFQHKMAVGDALKNYTLLTIGDGLVAQIPSLVLSTATAIMVTRVSKDQDMGGQLLSQLFASPNSLAVAAIIMGIMGVLPGMPNLAFLGLAGVAGIGAYMARKKASDISTRVKSETDSAATDENGQATSKPAVVDIGWDDIQPVDTVGLEVGFRLIPLVDTQQDGQLMARIKGVRKKLSQELGFLVASIHIRDNLDLAPHRYRVTMMGVTMAEADVYPERSLAINPGEVVGTPPEGVQTKDQAFGMVAIWIEAHHVDHVQMQCYTVVDGSTVIATHISQILREHASELLGREEVQRMLDKLGESYPRLVEDLVPDSISLGVLHRVLKNLLDEQIPIRDMRTIAENLASESHGSQDPAVLTAAVRVSLGRYIVSQISGMNGESEVLALDASLERILQYSNVTPGVGGLVIEPGLAEGMCHSLIECARRQEALGKPVALLVAPGLRPYLASFARQVIKDIHVLSYEEIPDKRNIRVVASVGGAQ